MNEHEPTVGLSDDDVIARLRSALDEVSAGSVASPTEQVVRPITATPTPSASPRRWVAIAAAAALVVAGAVAIAANRGKDAPSAVTDGTGAPTSTQGSTTSPSVVTDANWYVLQLPGFTAEPETSEACCPPMPAPGPTTVVAWGDVAGIEHGVLMLQSKPQISGEPTLSYSWAGMTDARAQQLIAEVVPGSGLPYVLPDESMQLLGTGFANIGNQRGQVWKGSHGTVSITVGDYRGQLGPLGLATFTPVSVAGQHGYQVHRSAGDYAVWQTPNGQWATLSMDPGLAGREDEIIAAVVSAPATPAPATTTTSTIPLELQYPTMNVTKVAGDPLPAYPATGPDPAVGQAMPTFVGDWKGNTLTVGPPTTGMLIVFAADWSPHSQELMPIVAGLRAKGAIPDTIYPVIVMTASGGSTPLFSTTDILRWGYQGNILQDRDPGDGSAGDVAKAYGADGFPFLVLIGSDGNVVRRTHGQLSAADVGRFVTGAETSAAATALTGVANLIDSGTGPMIATTFRTSLPPQGGNVPIDGFDWSMVDGEQTVAGTTWTDAQFNLTGTWDGTTFHLTQTPVPASTDGPVVPQPVMTPGCTLATMAPMLDALNTLDMKGLQIASTSSWNYDGHCGVKITALFDTPEVRAAAAKVGSDVTLEFVFHPVAG